MPVESSDGSLYEQSRHHRFSRCFLNYPDEDENLTKDQMKEIKSKIRDSRIHLKLIMSSTSHFVRHTTTLSNEQMQAQNKDQLDLFPSQCKPLPQRLLNLEISDEKRKCTMDLFFLLSYDAPLSSILSIPSSITVTG